MIMKSKKRSNDIESADLWLQHLSITLTSASSQVFANGRQQIEVQLDAIPLPGQSISTTEWATLRAVIEVRQDEYRDLPSFSASLPWGYTTAWDSDFDYYPTSDSISLEPSRTSADPAPKSIYIHSTAPSGNAVVLRAAITKDDGCVYYSTTNDGFESSIQLSSVRPANYNYPEDYTWQTQHEEGDISGGSNFLIEYVLSLKHFRFSYATLDADDTSGMIRWHTNEPNQTFASHVGIALIGSDRTVHYNTNIVLPDAFKKERMKTTVVSSNASSLVVLLQGDSRIPYHSASSRHQGPLTVTVVDRQGNGHNVSIRFTSEGTQLEKRTKLEVSTTPESQANSDPQAGTV
ncbi:MAG: hypothetical protein EOO15_13095 [Chitinophagaceae bacterium]|nr:MAG: hypothetical protein EOO15_13095 [Chitinophagaceae bacterium]